MINWYLNRLKTMSVAEIPYRVKQLAKKKYEQRFVAGTFPGSQTLTSKGKILDFQLDDRDLSKNHIQVFGQAFDFSQPSIDWHRDIFSGERFPLSFSKSINMRSTENISAKNVWEINRLQFLPTIALRYQQSGSVKHLDDFRRLISSWIDQNPYLRGINWYSNIEVNIRLVNWFLCWQILEVDEITSRDDTFKAFVENQWLPSIYQHCQYSYQNPSKFSSANNHLISEYAGLFVAASQWNFPECGKWKNYARKGLEEEIRNQHSSGINKEEAAEYIQFITDLFLLPLVVGEKTGQPFSAGYKEQLRQVFYYIYHLLDCNGHFPQYGDEDDGKVFFFEWGESFNNFSSLLSSGAILFHDPVLKSKSNGFDLKNRILFGKEGRRIYEGLPAESPDQVSAFYPEEGHFIFRKKEGDREIYLHFDAAPLGFLSIAAHGHADALSFILHLDGQPFFVDSGTYTYHTDPQWRQYFIGTLAHNTIRINQQDQAVNGGPTLWLRHYQCRVLEQESGEGIETIKATHNGYDKEQVRHVRTLTFYRAQNEIHIQDTIETKARKRVEVEIPFHFHPEVLIESTESNTFRLSHASTRQVEFRVDDQLQPIRIKGREKPELLGWYSRSFLKKEPTNVLYHKIQIEKTTSFRFIIKIIDYEH